MEGRERPLAYGKKIITCILATFSPVRQGLFPVVRRFFSAGFPQSRSCTTGIWVCTTGWRPRLYLCTPSPALSCERRSSLTHVSKPVPGVHGKRGLERGWPKRLAKGWRRVGEGLVEGCRRVGKGLAVSLHPPTLQFLRCPFRRAGL